MQILDAENKRTLKEKYEDLLVDLETMQITLNSIASSRRTSIVQTKIDEIRLWVEDGIRKGQF